MNAPLKHEVPAKVVAFKLNGREVEAFDGESILNAAKRNGVAIPHLCYKEGYRADGNCRACVVDIKGERTRADIEMTAVEVDGFAELWFDDEAALARAAQTPEMKALHADGALFIGRIKSWVVEEKTVIG